MIRFSPVKAGVLRSAGLLLCFLSTNAEITIYFKGPCAQKTSQKAAAATAKPRVSICCGNTKILNERKRGWCSLPPQSAPKFHSRCPPAGKASYRFMRHPGMQKDQIMRIDECARLGNSARPHIFYNICPLISKVKAGVIRSPVWPPKRFKTFVTIGAGLLNKSPVS